MKSGKLESTAVKDIHADIVEQCKAGDRSAQYLLFGLYKKAMYNVALRIVNDADDAEDVLQEAFISAFQNLGSFESRSTFGAWLKRIVVNKALSMLKSRKEFVESLHEGFDLEEETEAGFDEVEFKVEKVKKAISLLPDGFRSVLTLYLFEGYDHKDIADILGITVSTSKTQYLRAKNKLVQEIKKL